MAAVVAQEQDTPSPTPSVPCQLGPMADDPGCADAIPPQFCRLPTGTCLNKSAVWNGSCVPSPQFCGGEPLIRVCGCDGVEYQDECSAHASGASVASVGACPPVGVDTDAPTDAPDTDEPTPPPTVEPTPPPTVEPTPSPTVETGEPTDDPTVSFLE